MSEDEMLNYRFADEFVESLVWMETVLRQKAEVLVLKNGEKIQGIILSEDNGYLVFIPGGRKIFRFEDFT